jgi:hypothetical protein
LTATGRQKIDEKNIDNTTVEGKFLWYLKDHPGNSNLQEIAEETGLSYWRIKALCDKYASDQWRWVEWV